MDVAEEEGDMFRSPELIVNGRSLGSMGFGASRESVFGPGNPPAQHQDAVEPGDVGHDDARVVRWRDEISKPELEISRTT